MFAPMHLLPKIEQHALVKTLLWSLVISLAELAEFAYARSIRVTSSYRLTIRVSCTLIWTQGERGRPNLRRNSLRQNFQSISADFLADNKSLDRSAFSRLFIRTTRMPVSSSPRPVNSTVRAHRCVRTASGSDAINAQLESMSPSLPPPTLT